MAGNPISERIATRRALACIEGGDTQAALDILRAALKENQRRGPGVDDPTGVQGVRVCIEKVVVELEHGHADHVRHTLHVVSTESGSAMHSGISQVFYRLGKVANNDRIQPPAANLIF